MKQTIQQFLVKTRQAQYFRIDTLESGFIKTTTLQDILDNPQHTMDDLLILRGMGQVSFARLRQFLAREFVVSCPEDWEKAKEAFEKGTTPEGEQVEKLARFMKIWQVAADTINVHGRYYPAAALKTREIFDKIAIAKGEHFVHVLENLPDALKTSEMVAFERQRDKYSSGLPEKVRSSAKTQDKWNLNGLMLLDKFVMESLLTSTCIYRDLPEAARIKQLRNLKGFAQSQPKKLLYVVDYIENGLTPGFVSGEGPLITYAFGGIIELTAPDLVQTFKERAQAACKSGQTLQDWLSANAENPLIEAA